MVSGKLSGVELLKWVRHTHALLTFDLESCALHFEGAFLQLRFKNYTPVLNSIHLTQEEY